MSTDSIDYYQFTIADNSNVNLKLSGLSQDVTLQLYDSQQNLVEISATAGNADENITRNLRAGTYYVYATGGEKGTNYQLAASATSLGVVPSDNAGDSLDTAKNIGVLGSIPTVVDEYVGNFGTFGGSIDFRDYYQFTITENSTVDLNLSGLSQDTNISLFDSQGNSIKISDVRGTSDKNISQKLRSGTYFVSVSPASGFNSSTKNGTNYRFSANAVSLGSTPVDTSPLNQASDLGTITAVIPTLDGEIAAANFDKYYKFTLSENSTINLKLSGSNQDANIALLSSQGNIIVSAAKIGNVDETIGQNLRAGVYYLRAYRGMSGDPFATPTSLTFKLDASATSLGAIPIDNPGDSIDRSQDLGILKAEAVSATDFLGNFNNLSNDSTDYYKFTLADNSTVNLKLSGLSQDANLVLLNSNGKTILSSSNTGSSDENISRNLPKGTYYVRVDAGIGLFGFPTGPGGSVEAKNTTYKLDASAIALGAIPVDNAGENIDQSKDLGTLKTEVVSATDFLGNFNNLSNDFSDYYKFTLADNSTVNLKLSGLSQDANISLLNNNGKIILSSSNTGSSDENISRNLQKGTYYVRVDGGIGLYSLPTSQNGVIDAKNTTYKLDASAVSIGTPPVDNAGQTINTAKDLGVISEPQQIADYVGNFNGLSNDSADYYKFRVTTDSFLNLNFTETAINPNLQLFNIAGKLLSTPISFRNLANTSINQAITAGTYYLGVTPNGTVGSNYKLNLAAPTITDLAGSNNQTARDVGVLNSARAFNDFIGSIDSTDVYRFELKEKSTFNLNFNPDKSNDRTFISLTNAKGQLLTNINASTNPISQELAPGVYYAGIYNYGGSDSDTNYNLNLSAIAKQNSAAFQILNVTPIAGSNQGEASIDIKGTKFSPTAKVSIVDPSGKEVISNAVTVLNDTSIAAKFDLKGQVIGAYEVLSLVADPAYIIPVAPSASINITDNETKPTISVANITQPEGNSGTINYGFNITLSNPSTETITVKYTTADDTATAGTDYTAATDTVTFNPGETSKIVNVVATGDTLFEADETFKLNLSDAVNATIAITSATGSIVNDDVVIPPVEPVVVPPVVEPVVIPPVVEPVVVTPIVEPVVTPPVICISDAYPKFGKEGDPDAAHREFDIYLSHASAKTITVKYATVDGTAIGGSDFESIAPTTLTFAPGETYKTVSVKVIDDNIHENKESFIVELTNATNATLEMGYDYGIAKIIDDDLPGISIDCPDDAAYETDSDQPNSGKFTFKRTGSTTDALEVNYTIEGTATNGTDYTKLENTIEFAAGSDTSTIEINPIDDGISEGVETVTFKLSDSENYTIVGDKSETANITDLVLKVENLDKFKTPVGTGFQGKPEGEVIDLRGFAGQTLKVDTVSVGDAAYQNYIGFYTVEDAQGTLANGLKVGDAGYAQAAIKSAILRSSKIENQSDLTVSGGKIFAPVVIANGTFEDFLNRNPQNQANSNVHAYFNYLGANTDKVDHFRLLGDNKFGVEDLYGGGDLDYNDIVIQINVKS